MIIYVVQHYQVGPSPVNSPGKKIAVSKCVGKVGVYDMVGCSRLFYHFVNKGSQASIMGFLSS